VISVQNMSYSSHLDTRDQLKEVFGDVRLMGIMGSPCIIHDSPTNHLVVEVLEIALIVEGSPAVMNG